MLICLDCGRVFASASLGAEYWGECQGRPVYTYGTCCPYCGGATEAAE